MKIGYMTNAWGSVVGTPGGVTSIKDLFYCSTGDDQEAIRSISSTGFEVIEIFDGNLYAYRDDPAKFQTILKQNKCSLLSVYTGANFIFNDIYPEELYKIKEAASIAKEFHAKHLVIGGGALRKTHATEQDYTVLAKRLDELALLADDYGLIASYHPHLGSLVQSSEQLDKIMSLTSIHLCPDTGHLAAGGGDVPSIIEKYIDRIVYIHLKDYANGKFLPLGEGSIDFARIIQAAQSSGKNIDFTVEADGYEGDPVEAAETSYQFLKSFF